jgi:hypothetical protein
MGIAALNPSYDFLRDEKIQTIRLFIPSGAKDDQTTSWPRAAMINTDTLERSRD